VAEYVEAKMSSDLDYLGMLQQATQLTVAGNFQSASVLYRRAILKKPLKFYGYLKYGRHVIFKASPTMGVKFFRK
jgi:hypothetical protein